jgi:hypothetical protein
VIIDEGGKRKGKEEQGREALEKARKQLEAVMKEGQKAAKVRMREKIKRQHELAEQAWKTVEKMETLGEGKQGEAHQLWERLEQLEGQLRQTFEPQPGAMAPGQPLTLHMYGQANLAPGASVPGAMKPFAPQLGAPMPGASMPGAPAINRSWGGSAVVPLPNPARPTMVAPGSPLTVTAAPGTVLTITAAPAGGGFGVGAAGAANAYTPASPYSPGPLMPAPGATMTFGLPAGPSTAPATPNREAVERTLKEMLDKVQKAAKEGNADQAKYLKHEAEELRQGLERSSRQPRGQAQMPAPGQPLNVQSGQGWTMLQSGQPANVRPGQPANPQVRSDPAVQELRTQVQDLRRQVEEIKGMLKKMSEQKK